MNYFDKIDEYLLGRLTTEEVVQFEKEIIKNDSLRAEVEKQKLIIDAVKITARKSLKADLVEISKRNNENKKPVTRSFILWPYISAAAICIFGLVSWWLINSSSPSFEELYADNYKPFQVLSNTRNSADQTQLKNAFEFYGKGDYENANKVFNTVDQTSYDGQFLLARAISYHEIGLNEEAFGTLALLIRNRDPFLMDLANWYSGLFNLRAGQIEKAKSFFQILANDSSADMHIEALEILKKIK